MSKGHARNAGYQPGNNWDTCDRCGFERRVSDLSEEWTGLTVCTDTCFETRHPQEFLRVQEERIAALKSGSKDSTDNVSDQTAADAIDAQQAADPTAFTVPSGTNNNEL